MKIFHFSDLHFDGSSSRKLFMNECADAFVASSDCKVDQNDMLVLSGDITLKGSIDGYSVAKEFVRKIWIDNGGDRANIIICPGNHDIVEGGFVHFDRFTFSVRRNSEISFVDHNVANFLITPNCNFLVLNSAHHLDYKFGSIDIRALQSFLSTHVREFNSSKRVAVVHHNFMGLHTQDVSILRTGLPLLQLLGDHNFSLVLHGHQHANMKISVGNQMQLCGVRSLLTTDPSYSHGMLILTSSDAGWDCESYSFKKDARIATILSLVKD